MLTSRRSSDRWAQYFIIAAAYFPISANSVIGRSTTMIFPSSRARKLIFVSVQNNSRNGLRFSVSIKGVMLATKMLRVFSAVSGNVPIQ